MSVEEALQVLVNAGFFIEIPAGVGWSNLDSSLHIENHGNHAAYVLVVEGIHKEELH